MPLPPWADAGLLALLGLCLAVIGYFLRQVHKKVDSATDWRMQIKEELAQSRVLLERDLRETRGTIYSKLDTIKDGINLINGRIGKMETWSEQHEKNDDTRHEAENGRLEDHHQRIGQLERRQWRRPEEDGP